VAEIALGRRNEDIPGLDMTLRSRVTGRVSQVSTFTGEENRKHRLPCRCDWLHPVAFQSRREPF